ncbi:hypothetical protein MHYP_G00170390 [Metynnis hypsauchen]
MATTGKKSRGEDNPSTGTSDLWEPAQEVHAKKLAMKPDKEQLGRPASEYSSEPGHEMHRGPPHFSLIFGGNINLFLCCHSWIFMSAGVGSSAVLPCNSRNVSIQSPHVEWRTYAETVFERRGGDLYQGEGYEDCVDMPEDHLLKEDCSLELKNNRPEDAGVYESFLLVR